MPGLNAAARDAPKGPPIYSVAAQAAVLLSQFQETAACRDWRLLGVAIMANHLHLVVGVSGDPEPDVLVRDFKSYGSRALNRVWNKPQSGTWWTAGGGSRRKLPNEPAVDIALEYLRLQYEPLLIWFASGEPGASAPGEGEGA